MASCFLITYYIFVISLVSVGSGFRLNNVRNMKVDQIEKILLPGTRKWPSFITHQKVSSKLGGTFKWNLCNNDPSLVNLESLNVSPDPVHLPGALNVQFTAMIKETIDAPLKVNLTLKKEITPDFWLKIPCIEGIGSCIYEDLCDTLAGATCPDPFVKYNIPCKCPFNKGSYKMKSSSFNIDVSDIPTGTYSAKAILTYQEQVALCLEMDFKLA